MSFDFKCISHIQFFIDNSSMMNTNEKMYIKFHEVIASKNIVWFIIPG